jgi:hypothetical protein
MLLVLKSDLLNAKNDPTTTARAEEEETIELQRLDEK